MVVPICGIRGCLYGTVSDILGRAFSSFRLVLISSYSPSGYPRVYSNCTRGSGQMGIVRRGRGRKLDKTHGAKLRFMGNGCMAFVSSSSCVGSSLLRVISTSLLRGPTRYMIFNVGRRCYSCSNGIAGAFSLACNRRGHVDEIGRLHGGMVILRRGAFLNCT